VVETDGPEPYVRPGDAAQGGGGEFVTRDDGQLHFEPGTEGNTFPIEAPVDATPLGEDEPEGTIPASPLWSLKDHRHEQWPHLFGHPDRIRRSFGTGDDTVYVIDDGKRHCMIGRRVGASPDECVYSLTGRITIDTYHDLASGMINGHQAFLEASDLGLSGTAEATGVSNVIDIEFYDHPDDVPKEYLPPAPFINFPEDLPTIDD